MKALKLWPVLLALLTANVVWSNVPDGNIYFNDRMEVVKNEKNATYYAQFVRTDQWELHHFKVYYLTGELKMEGSFADKAMKQPHGEFTFYYQSGQIESQGEYRNGHKYGIWQRFDMKGNEKPEKVYATHVMMQAIGVEASK